MRAKRPASELELENPDPKKNKGCSPDKKELAQRSHLSQNFIAGEVYQTKETVMTEEDDIVPGERAAVAGIQHRRQL